MWKLAVACIALSAARLFAQSSESALRGYFEQGEKALAEERYADAELSFEKLAKLAPNVAEVYGRLGLVYFQEKRYADAVPALRRALKLKPGLPNTDILLAMSLSEAGNYNEALTGLEKGFRHSNDAALKRMSGLQLERAYTGLRRDNDAAQVALELTRLYPEDPEILYHSGRLFGNFAYLSMRKLAEVAPDSVWRHEAAGDAYESAANHILAIAEYRQVLSQDPRRPGIHYRLGRALQVQPGSTADAAKEFEQELAIDPANANAAYELAELYRKSGQIEKARDLFETALKFYPDFQEANVGLGRSLIALGKLDPSLVYLRKATALNPRDATAYYLLAQAYKAAGNSAEQSKALERFQSLRNENAARQTGLLESQDSVTKQEIEQE